MITHENQWSLASVACQPGGAGKRQTPVSLSRLVVFSLFALLAVHSSNAAAQEMQWRDAASFEIEGRGWIQTAGPFDRLPDSARAKVNSTAWKLSAQSAGISVRFVTDAAAVGLRWSLTSASLDMPHMPATGVSGLDLYARSAEGSWRFIGNGRPHKQDGNLATLRFPDGAKARRECLLYLPVYNGTKSLEIGVPPDAHLEMPAPRPEGLRKPLVVYGTSITQGGCASRPGMVWTSILGRMLERPVINLGFSGSGDMAPPVGEVLAEPDAAAYVIDCTWNMGTGKEMFLDHVTKLVQAIRKAHPVTPILFMGQSMFRPNAHPTERTRDQEFAVQSLQKDGVKGLVILAPDDFIGDDGEGTVDGVHYTDIGMQRQAQSLFPIVRTAVSGSMKPHVYIDTDTANEVDDPFAIYRALLAPEFNVVGLSSAGWGAPNVFGNNTRTSQKMNEELLALLKLGDRVSHPIGALRPMPEASTPVDSPAARDLIAKAKAMPGGRELQVFVLGAYTTVASALLMDPGIKDKIAVHVMGFRYDDKRLTPSEFNTMGDLHAAAHLLRSGVELKIMQNTALGDFVWSKAEVDAHFKGKGGVPDYLVKRWETHCPKDTRRILWDIAVFEAVLRPELATQQEIEHEGAKIHVWTAVDLPGMKADYWKATEASVEGAVR